MPQAAAPAALHKKPALAAPGMVAPAAGSEIFEDQTVDIHGVQPPLEPNPVETVGPITPKGLPIQPTGISDVVEISTAARLAAKIQELPEIRAELVQRVKAEIAEGVYETSERLEITVERLMEELFPDL